LVEAKKLVWKKNRGKSGLCLKIMALVYWSICSLIYDYTADSGSGCKMQVCVAYLVWLSACGWIWFGFSCSAAASRYYIFRVNPSQCQILPSKEDVEKM
jgi:hypothetical protein